MTKALKYLVLSQVVFLFFMLICFGLEPEYFFDNAALSFYGTSLKTIVPYAAGTLIASFLLLKSAAHLHHPSKNVRTVQTAIRVLAGLLIAALLVPYSINPYFFVVHMLIGVLLMLVMLGVSTYIIATIDKRPLNIAIFVSELVVTVLLVLSFGFIGVLHIQALAELVASLLFFGLLFNTLKDLRAQ